MTVPWSLPLTQGAGSLSISGASAGASARKPRSTPKPTSKLRSRELASPKSTSSGCLGLADLRLAGRVGEQRAAGDADVERSRLGE